jgi:hypothetical protein
MTEKEEEETNRIVQEEDSSNAADLKYRFEGKSNFDNNPNNNASPVLNSNSSITNRTNKNLAVNSGRMNPVLRRSTSASSIFLNHTQPTGTSARMSGFDFSESEDADYLAKFPNPFEVSFRDSFHSKFTAASEEEATTNANSGSETRSVPGGVHSNQNNLSSNAKSQAQSTFASQQANDNTKTAKIDPIDHWSRLEYIATILPTPPTRTKVRLLHSCFI